MWRAPPILLEVVHAFIQVLYIHDTTWIKGLESRDARIELNAVPVEYRRLKKSTDAFFHVLLEVKVIVGIHKHIVSKFL